MESADQYGPALPPGMVTTSEATAKSINPAEESTPSSSSRNKVVGPQLPPGHQRSVDSDDMSDENPLTVKMESPKSEAQDCGDDSHGEDVVGPMPSEMSQDGEDVVQAAEEFERRSKRMKDKLSVKSEADEGPVKREEWMTELPPEMSKNFGLQSRTFSKGRQDDDGGDRSIWTDTPGSKKEKESKGKKRKRDEEKLASAREEQMQQQVEEYNKANRPDSLLEMHSKKQKKKKKKDKKEKKKKKERGEKEEKEARRPFDRDADLQVNKFDDAQRKLIIQKSQALNTRFQGGGSTSSFL